MANHRFETGKKKVNHLTFDDYSYCAVLMIANWSYSAIGNTIPTRSYTCMEIEHEIISAVILLPSADSFKKVCCQL